MLLSYATCRSVVMPVYANLYCSYYALMTFMTLMTRCIILVYCFPKFMHFDIIQSYIR
jgi:hypothetical protein